MGYVLNNRSTRRPASGAERFETTNQTRFRETMTRNCQRCERGRVIGSWGEDVCINCGWSPSEAYYAEESRLIARIKRLKVE